MAKKIVIIGPAYPLRGGLATFDQRLCKQFNDEGYDCCIFSFSLQYPSFLFPGTTQYSSDPPPAGIEIYSMINTVHPLNWLQTGHILKRMRPDIIVVRFWLPLMGPALGTILRIVKKNKHTRVIAITDNIRPHEKRPGEIARSRLGISPGDKVMLFFGFIRKYKGLDILLDAMKILNAPDFKPKIANLKLLIAGEFYEDKKPYLDQIMQSGIGDMLILKTDFIPDSEVKYYLGAADVVIQPYRNATQSGVTPLAYHFEKPMIVTNVGSLPSLVPHEKVGLVCAPEPMAIAEAVIHYFELGEKYFIPHLRREKEKYSWHNLVE